MTDAPLPVGQIIMGLLGGLALFLFGMEQMTDGLKAVAGAGMKKLLAGLTRNRVMGAITGALVTAVIQSSSVTTVLVVGFVSAGLMTLAASVGVIMGANVGTTITAQIVAFKVTKYALVLVFIGFLMIFAGKKARVRQWGSMVMGLGLIFFGMGLMSDATSPLRTYEPFIALMRQMDNPIFGMLVAALFTALVQSSSATTGIVIVLASQGFISLEAGIALAFGANVGTCVTAVLATLGKPRIAMRAAAVHIIFNIVGVLIWLPLIDQLGEFVRWMSPASAELEGMARLAAETPRQIANAHTIFNVVNTVLLLPFTTLIARGAEFLVKDKPEVLPEQAQPRYLDAAFLLTPPLAADAVRRELVRFGKYVADFATEVITLARSGGEFDAAALAHRHIGHLYDSIVAYLRTLVGEETDEEMTQHVQALTAIATDMEHIAEIFAMNVVSLASQQKRQELASDTEAQEILQELLDLATAAFGEALRAVQGPSTKHARHVMDMKPRVQMLAGSCLNRLTARIDPNDPKSLSQFRLHSSIVDLLRRYYYFSKKIAKEVVGEVEKKRVADTDVTQTLGG